MFIRQCDFFWGYLNEGSSYYKTLCDVVTGQTWTVTDLCVYFAPYVFLQIFSVSL